MASSKNFINFILEQMQPLMDIQFKPMMGEYLLYYKGKLVGGVYDDKLLVKKTDTNKNFDMPEALPYSGAKMMYMIEDIDNIKQVKRIIIATYEGLN